ncbi:MAG: hypothetical protein KJ655_03105 [Candidatus Thermoplasmatota archaeon]|nr:hypothetical protein [Candidatus Thermoplasmatota archaeon]
MTDRLDKRLEARKKAYEQRMQAKQAKLNARRAQYEARKHADISFGVGVSSIRKDETKKWIYKPAPARERGRIIKPEFEEKPLPLVDAFDEDGYLRISVQLLDFHLPEDIAIDQIKEVSFRHGVFEIKLRKKKEEIPAEEKEIWEKGEEVTAEVNKKVMLMLKKSGDEIVSETLREPSKNQGEYQLYNERGELVSTYSSREIAVMVAKKKGCTIRHVKKQGVRYF